MKDTEHFIRCQVKYIDDNRWYGSIEYPEKDSWWQEHVTYEYLKERNRKYFKKFRKYPNDQDDYVLTRKGDL